MSSLTPTPLTTARPSSEATTSVSRTEDGPQQEAGAAPKQEVEGELSVSGGTKDFGFLPIPRGLRHDPGKPFKFTTLLNITFGFGSTFSEWTQLNLRFTR